jgi:DNA replication protein DnaD
LWNEGVFVKNDKELLDKLNYYLDNEYIRNDLSDEGLAHIRNKLVFKKEIEKMSDYINELLKKLPIVKKSEKIKDMIKQTKRKGGVTKKDFIEYLGWGVGIKWTPYRRALLTNPKIYDTMSKDPVYKWIK